MPRNTRDPHQPPLTGCTYLSIMEGLNARNLNAPNSPLVVRALVIEVEEKWVFGGVPQLSPSSSSSPSPSHSPVPLPRATVSLSNAFSSQGYHLDGTPVEPAPEPPASKRFCNIL